MLREVARQRRSRFVRSLQTADRWKGAQHMLNQNVLDGVRGSRDTPGICLVPLAHGDEPDLAEAAGALEAAGWTIARPVVRPTMDAFDAVAWPTDGPLRTGPFGILEPALEVGATDRAERADHDSPSVERDPTSARHGAPYETPPGTPIRSAEVDVVLVPGLVFDRRGHRLGYGGGMFDRFLTSMDRTAGPGEGRRGQAVPALRSAVAYAWSVARYPHPLPNETHDREVPVLVCEDGTFVVP